MNDGYTAPNIPSPLTNAINRLNAELPTTFNPVPCEYVPYPLLSFPAARVIFPSPKLSALDTDPTDLAIFESIARSRRH